VAGCSEVWEPRWNLGVLEVVSELKVGCMVDCGHCGQEVQKGDFPCCWGNNCSDNQINYSNELTNHHIEVA